MYLVWHYITSYSPVLYLRAFGQTAICRVPRELPDDEIVVALLTCAKDWQLC